MSIVKLKDVINMCDLYGLGFKRGSFSKGERYIVELHLLGQDVVSWPCQTLDQCTEAIYQADYLRHHKVLQ
jgi:hypothetical protein